MKRVLIIEDDELIRSNILDLVQEEGFSGAGAADGETGLSEALANPPDVVICDIMMPGMDGWKVLERMRAHPATARVPFIFLTAKSDRADVRAGMNLGADDYLTKPYSRVELLEAIHTRLRRFEELQRGGLPELAPLTSPPPRVVVKSRAMRTLYDEAARAARSNLSVLVLGETGVGKDVLAYEIHRRSPRAAGAYLPLHCATLSETLLESELFGHEKGAFTGANSAQPGLFESADGGTVFVDEAGDLPPVVQVKLLRVLEERVVMRVGSRTPRRVDVRFIAATNRDLEREVEKGTFRRDLFFRINGIALRIPPLRERREEIEPLAQSFAERAAAELGRSVPSIAPEALSALESHDWPGNARELRNAMDRAVALCPGDVVTVEHLGLEPTNGEAPPTGAFSELRREVKEMEKQRIIEALELHDQHQGKTAAYLGISRRTLISRMDEFNLPRPRKK